VPLYIESMGAPQQVALAQQPANIRGRTVLIDKTACTTPCTLEVEPGAHQVRLSGARTAPSVTDLVVPLGGLNLKMYAPSAKRWRLGFMLTISALGPVIAGAVYAGIGSS
jgi:hypothetical protein